MTKRRVRTAAIVQTVGFLLWAVLTYGYVALGAALSRVLPLRRPQGSTTD